MVGVRFLVVVVLMVVIARWLFVGSALAMWSLASFVTGQSLVEWPTSSLWKTQ